MQQFSQLDIVIANSMCSNSIMCFYRTFAVLLLVLFSIGTVHAASMGIAVQFIATQDAPVMHCHDMGDQAEHGDNHVKPHQGNACTSCAACVPMMLSQATWCAFAGIQTEENPHDEASYASFIGKLPHRPPISA
jgi:hypothetical protein